MRRLLEQGESAMGILLVAIVPTIRNLLLAKDLMEQHGFRRPHSPFQFISAINRLPTKATEHLPRKKDGSINAYGLGIAAQHAHQFESNQLIEAMRACLDANVKLVTTQLDHELILTEVVVKLLGEKEGRLISARSNDGCGLEAVPYSNGMRSFATSACARSVRCRECPSARP